MRDLDNAVNLEPRARVIEFVSDFDHSNNKICFFTRNKIKNIF